MDENDVETVKKEEEGGAEAMPTEAGQGLPVSSPMFLGCVRSDFWEDWV